MRRRTCLATAVLAVLVGGAMAPAVDVVASQDAKVFVEPIAGMPNRLMLGDTLKDQDENFAGNLGTGSVGYYAAFKLPTLAAGETFSSASIKITLHGQNLYQLPQTYPLPQNASLKFMGIFDALSGDWKEMNGPAQTLLQNDFSTPAAGRKDGGTGVGPGGWDYVTQNSSLAGNAALVAAMNSATPTKLDGTAPVSADRYLYVMLAWEPYDVLLNNSSVRYQIASLASSAGGGAGPEFDPTFTYETVGVPEPSMLALAGIGSLGLLRRRRR